MRNETVDYNEFMNNMKKTMNETNELTDLISKEFNMVKKDAFVIALSVEDSKPYIRELKLRNLLD
jgi:hypothetical protein